MTQTRPTTTPSRDDQASLNLDATIFHDTEASNDDDGTQFLASIYPDGIENDSEIDDDDDTKSDSEIYSDDSIAYSARTYSGYTGNDSETDDEDDETTLQINIIPPLPSTRNISFYRFISKIKNTISEAKTSTEPQALGLSLGNLVKNNVEKFKQDNASADDHKLRYLYEEVLATAIWLVTNQTINVVAEDNTNSETIIKLIIFYNSFYKNTHETVNKYLSVPSKITDPRDKKESQIKSHLMYTYSSQLGIHTSSADIPDFKKIINIIIRNILTSEQSSTKLGLFLAYLVYNYLDTSQLTKTKMIANTKIIIAALSSIHTQLMMKEITKPKNYTASKKHNINRFFQSFIENLGVTAVPYMVPSIMTHASDNTTSQQQSLQNRYT